MRTAPRRTALPLALVVLAAAGCESVAENAGERLVEEAAGADDVEIDADSGEVRVETSEGSFQTGGDLPGDLPGDVPVPEEGELVTATRQQDGDGTAWILAWQVESGDPQEHLDRLVAAFEDAGWTPAEDGEFSVTGQDGGMASVALSKGDLEGSAGFMGGPDDFLLNVTVREASGG